MIARSPTRKGILAALIVATLIVPISLLTALNHFESLANLMWIFGIPAVVSLLFYKSLQSRFLSFLLLSLWAFVAMVVAGIIAFGQSV
jgi:hypothetical protein